ncbi:Mediator of RNA polymerase II transcription subunit 33A [Apostasia shenzhenica]|uniref:Mediator of RNA polymerase II transcription subunit 33A n=1 Tax=Apostasia shenzhenica TaxID=1088818 RepID=A0A2I0AUU0_9ASPA|nr:Mediator of RNA polymerase II transcription subunit 33A [Apostasia shenzhenica]
MREEIAPAWERVTEFTKAAQEKGTEAVTWAVRLSSGLASFGVSLPSPELAHVLVSHVFWANEGPLAWKYLEKAIAAGLAPPMLLIALLSSRSLSLSLSLCLSLILGSFRVLPYFLITENQIRIMIMVSVDDVLHLSEIFGIQASEPGTLVVEFTFCIVWQLLDATLDDEGLLELTPEKKSRWPTRSYEMDIDGKDYYLKTGYSESLRKQNSVKAVELILHFLQNKKISRLISLARENMPCQWSSFTQHLGLLSTNSSALRNSSLQLGTLKQLGGQCHGTSHSTLWIPIDLYLEDCIDGSVAATNAIEILSGLLKTLRAVNQATWHDSFLGLWMASLRLVQRERDPHEGPVPRLDSRLCILLSVTTLAIATIIDEEEANPIGEVEQTIQWKRKAACGNCRQGLVSCLQILGDYESLLAPPSSVTFAANLAAAKAMISVSGLPNGSGFLECINLNDNSLNCSGNLWHLIVEACISRKLLDTSAYFWPGYVSGKMKPIPHNMTSQVAGWSTLMKGAPLTSSLVNALARNPASSLAELEKIFEIAFNGSDDDKVSAASILCAASLIRGWNIQEHAVRFAMKLLSPPVPIDYSGTDSHLISHGPVMNVVLTGISSVDCVQVFSFHGLVPELAGALMAICEVFGACVPNIAWTITGEEVTAHSVFSNAFILLLRLWKFNHPPLEYCIMGDGAPVGSQLTLEYLLLLCNARLLSSCNSNKECGSKNGMSITCSSLTQPIFVDSFPKLKVWYRQHQACLASTLSGLVHGTPVHQNVDGILNMMFRKINRVSSQSVGPGASGSSSLSSSSGPGSEDSHARPMLPAWDIMEAVPFVVDAALTACSHGRLSPRELATGLKDLADFLPASLATIVSYFSAEVTRGVWKPAFMNGTDWPSPAANVSIVEEHIKKIVAATGVDVPSLVDGPEGGSSQATLPLPLAAFVSLTITYKLDKASERFLNLAGPALENLAASCPWPSMPIVAALWTQKVKRWTDFLVFSASRTVFHHNDDAVVQLLRSCFSATLGFSGSQISTNGGVGGLLGHGFGSHFSGGLSPVAPGILYLRTYRCIKDIIRLTEEILSILMQSVKEIAETAASKERFELLKKTKNGLKYAKGSLCTAMAKVKVAASLAATFVWLSGGSGLIHGLIQEMLPSWFLSVHELDEDGRCGSLAYALGGYALAYFAAICGIFAWGIDSMPSSKRRPRIIESHMEFLASAMDGKISLGCDSALWRGYVSGFLSLMVDCAPSWVVEVDVGVLRRLSRGLRLWNEDELALALLRKGGVGAMASAAEVILASD